MCEHCTLMSYMGDRLEVQFTKLFKLSFHFGQPVVYRLQYRCDVLFRLSSFDILRYFEALIE